MQNITYNISMENQLTFLIIIHNKFENIPIFIEMLKNLNGKADVVFAFDCETVDDKYINLINESKFKVFVNEHNSGKLALIVKTIPLIKTNFFKVVDQDDEIFLNEIDQCNNSLSVIDNRTLVKHRGAKLYKGKVPEEKFVMTSDEKEILYHISKAKAPLLSQQTNFDTIYPTKVVSALKDVDITRQDFHNDVLLSNFVLGMTKKFRKIDSLIYIQFHGNGQTSKYNLKRAECIIELYENYLKIKKAFPTFDFKRLMWRMKISHYFFIKAFTLWYIKDDKQEAKRIFKESIKAWKRNYK